MEDTDSEENVVVLGKLLPQKREGRGITIEWTNKRDGKAM
jgi:hypothetical protein